MRLQLDININNKHIILIFSVGLLVGLLIGTAIYNHDIKFVGINASNISISEKVIVGKQTSLVQNAQGLIEVMDDKSYRLSLLLYNGSDATERADINFYRARGNLTNPEAVQVGDILGSVVWDGWTGRGFAEGAKIDAIVSGTPSRYHPTTLYLRTSNATHNFISIIEINSTEVVFNRPILIPELAGYGNCRLWVDSGGKVYRNTSDCT
jgi:hypothetical protein